MGWEEGRKMEVEVGRWERANSDKGPLSCVNYHLSFIVIHDLLIHDDDFRNVTMREERNSGNRIL